MIVLAGLAILLFPDRAPASPLLRRALWLYLAPALLWMVSAYVLTVGAIIGHDIRVDSGGNLLALVGGPSSPGWWNVLQDVVFITIALGPAAGLWVPSATSPCWRPSSRCRSAWAWRS